MWTKDDGKRYRELEDKICAHEATSEEIEEYLWLDYKRWYNR